MKLFRLIIPIALLAGMASGQTIVVAPDAPANVQLAAKEIRRYAYLRTGKLMPIAATGQGIALSIDPALEAQEYRIGPNKITGGSDVGVLYGAYRYAELLGVRFYLHGDVIPDEPMKDLPTVKDELGKPLFETRGIQPFHDFMEGPDWWNTDDYLTYIGQLPKMRMNFLGLHAYPERGGEYPGPEPTVWIGLPGDVGKDGRVNFSYPSLFANTQRAGWGNTPKPTSQYAGGAALLFPGDTYGPDVQAGHFPWPKDPDAFNEVFNRTGDMYRQAFSHARTLGVKVCIGTETPLTIPQRVKERLRSQGKNPEDPAVARDLYQGAFLRISRAFPIDYYWLWTPEDWTWSGNNPKQFEETTRDIQAALGALDTLGHPFTLATSGWVLGPTHDRSALDTLLPKDSPMSCISRNVGHEGVEPAFANVSGRPKWAIPWMENDPNMVGPQPWAARIRHDAVDARRFGCTGLIGIHWRTQGLMMNFAALAASAWDQSWVPADFDITPVKPSKGGEGALDGKTVQFSAAVANATPTPMDIYQSVRYDLSGYTLTVPDGQYTVTLQLNEPAYAAIGKRVFGVKLQGQQVAEHVDIHAKAGGQNRALELSYPETVVSDGTLRIGFTKEVDLPCVAGIVINGMTKAVNQLPGQPFTRKINCGGGKVADYEADRVSGFTAPPAGMKRAMPIEDFYIDFARANFGDAVATTAGKLLAKIDGVNLPIVSRWDIGPGRLLVNGAPWEEVRKSYGFVDDLTALRQQVQGAGNRERFDYWLNTYLGMRCMAELACLRGQLDRSMSNKNFEAALKVRLQLGQAWSRLLSYQTACVSTPGELGTIANLEHLTRSRGRFVDGHDEALAKALGRPLPADAQPGMDYNGPARLVVMNPRTRAGKGESLTLRIIALSHSPCKSVSIRVRPLGSSGEWQAISATHIARAVWQAKFPAATEDFEYHIVAEFAGSQKLTWPVTAPKLNQSVIVTE